MSFSNSVDIEWYRQSTYIIIYIYIYVFIYIYIYVYINIYGTPLQYSPKKWLYCNFQCFCRVLSFYCWLQKFWRSLSKHWLTLHCVLHLQTQNFAKLCKVFWIQDSRFKILRKTSWIRAQVHAWIEEVFLRILNLESCIQETLQSFAKFWESRFKIQDSRSWEKLLESEPRSTPGFKKFFPESWILNLVSRKLCKVLQSLGFEDAGRKVNQRLLRLLQKI